jgi:hypothetical protein
VTSTNWPSSCSDPRKQDRKVVSVTQLSGAGKTHLIYGLAAKGYPVLLLDLSSSQIRQTLLTALRGLRDNDNLQAEAKHFQALGMIQRLVATFAHLWGVIRPKNPGMQGGPLQVWKLLVMQTERAEQWVCRQFLDGSYTPPDLKPETNAVLAVDELSELEGQVLGLFGRTTQGGLEIPRGKSPPSKMPRLRSEPPQPVPYPPVHREDPEQSAESKREDDGVEDEKTAPSQATLTPEAASSSSSFAQPCVGFAFREKMLEWLDGGFRVLTASTYAPAWIERNASPLRDALTKFVSLRPMASRDIETFLGKMFGKGEGSDWFDWVGKKFAGRPYFFFNGFLKPLLGKCRELVDRPADLGSLGKLVEQTSQHEVNKLLVRTVSCYVCPLSVLCFPFRCFLLPWCCFSVQSSSGKPSQPA